MNFLRGNSERRGRRNWGRVQQKIRLEPQNIYHPSSVMARDRAKTITVLRLAFYAVGPKKHRQKYQSAEGDAHEPKQGNPQAIL